MNVHTPIAAVVERLGVKSRADNIAIAEAPALLAELKRLLAVCIQMDAEQEGIRPTEEEYMAAVQGAAKAIFRAENP